MNKKTGFGVFALLIVISVVSFLLYLTDKDKTIYADEFISSVSGRFKTGLNDFLESADKSLQETRQNIKHYSSKIPDQADLNQLSVNQMKNNKKLKGIMLFSKNMNYVMLREENSWATTYNYNATDTLLNWQRLNQDMEVISSWSDTYNFFMNKQNRDLIEQNSDSSGNIFWRTARSQIPGKRELIIEISGFENIKGHNFLLGMIYRTPDLVNKFSEIFQFNSPLVNIIDERNHLITPISTSDTAKIEFYSNLSKEIEKLLPNWIKNQNSGSHSYSFEKNNMVYWARFDTINNPELKGFVISVSENDINDAVKIWRYKYLYSSLFIAFIAIIYLLIYLVVLRRKNRISAKPLKHYEKSTLLKLIEKGETSKLEFKSSLRYDYKLEKENKILEDVILKSIAAFANARGGTLLIGLDDDKNILGLENDFNTLKKSDIDGFELHITRLITNQFGLNILNEGILLYFEQINTNQICVIRINPSFRPLFLKTKNKNGNPIEKFYVRSGNASQEINSLNEINNYIRRRFRKKYIS